LNEIYQESHYEDRSDRSARSSINKAVALVNEGWFRDEKDVFSEAIRRFLDTHQSELMQKFVRDDIEWGLHGND